jgi:hypothetical protein
MTDKTLDSDFLGHGRPARPSNGGEVVIGGGGKHDPEGSRLPAGSLGNGRVMPAPGGMPGLGIAPVSKDPSPADTR